MEKIVSEASWYGEELAKRSDWHYPLNREDIDEIDDAWQTTRSHSCVEISRDDFALGKLARRLAEIQESLETGPGIAMLQGFPVEKYSEEDLRRIFWGLASHIGTPISQSATGDKIFSVRNEGYADGDSRARGPNTKNKLSFHTDRCDVIAFMCLQQAASGGENLVVSSIALHNEILARRPDLLQVLYEPFYYKRHNVDKGNQLPYCQMPIFATHEGHFAANIMRVLIHRAHQMSAIPEMTPAQREALDLIETIAAEKHMHIKFTQRKGDILFLNNFVTFHSRTEFSDYLEPERRRHLLRIWLSVPNSRPLSPLFAPNYGNTKAGAIRGGMKPEG